MRGPGLILAFALAAFGTLPAEPVRAQESAAGTAVVAGTAESVATAGQSATLLPDGRGAAAGEQPGGHGFR